MATFSNSDPYLAIERALRAARRPSDEGPRSRAMWDQYQADREPYGNRPWKPTPGPVITEREVEAVADELGVTDEEAAELIRQTARAAQSDASDAGWMAEGLAQYGMLNAAIQQAPTLKGIAETFTKVGKPETWSTPEKATPSKAALTPAAPPTPQSIAPFSPAAVPSPPQSLEEFAAEMGRAQMAAANYSPEGIETEEAPGIESEPAEPADVPGPESQYEETDRTGMFANPEIGRAAQENPSRFSEMFTQPQSLLAMLEPPAAPAPVQPSAPAVARDPGLGRTPGFASRGLAAAAINPEELGIPGPDIAGARAAGLAAGVGLPGLAYAPATPAFDVPTPALAYAPSVPSFDPVTTPGIAYAPSMPAFDEVETPAIAYSPQAPVAEVAGPAISYDPQAPTAEVATRGLGYDPALPAFPVAAISPDDIQADEVETVGPDMVAARAAAAAQAALSAPEFAVPGPDLTAARNAAAAQAGRQAVSDLETALIPAPLTAPSNVSAVGRGIAGPASELTAAQDYGFDPATIRQMTPGQRLSERARGLTANTAPRSSPISGIVMHETFGVSNMPGGVISAANERGAGYHYVIDIEGKVHQMVPENQTIAHIGDREVAAFSNSPLRNANTIGIGIQTHAGTRPNAAQMRAAAGLARSIAAKHGIDVTTGVVGHGDLASRGQGPSAEGRSAVNELRGMPNEDTRAETGPDRPRTVDPLTRTTPGRRAGIESIINTLLGIPSAAAAPAQDVPSAFGATTFLPPPTPAATAPSAPSIASSGLGASQGGQSSAQGKSSASSSQNSQATAHSSSSQSAGRGATSSAPSAAASQAQAAAQSAIKSEEESRSSQQAHQAPAMQAIAVDIAPAPTVGFMGQKGMTDVIVHEDRITLPAINVTEEFDPNMPSKAMGFVFSEDAMRSGPTPGSFRAAQEVGLPTLGFRSAQEVGVPRGPAYGSFRAAQEQGLEESEESEESEENQGLENSSFNNAFGNPSAFSGLAGMSTTFSGVEGIGLGNTPNGVDNTGPAETGSMFGGLGIGQAAAETAASQMSSLGLEGLFSQGFENPGQYSGVTSNDPSPSSSEDSDDAEGTGPSGPAGPSSAADAAAGVGVDTSSSQDGPGTGTGTGADPSGGSTGVGDNTGGMNGGFDGTEGGNSGGMGGGGMGGDPSGGTGEGASESSSGGGWARRGGYIDDTFDVWSDAERDRAVMRAIRAANEMLRKEYAYGGRTSQNYNRGGEVVYSAIDYLPDGISYQQVIQRALRAAR